jgi:type II secretory ATPase GspE/PulE/Tfp pilus assembly ATPase PilB-like protein
VSATILKKRVEAMSQNRYEMPATLRIGELLVEEGFLREKDVEKALEIQSRETADSTGKNPRAIGEILCDLNLISPADLNYILKKYAKQLKLGDILLNQGILREDELSDALCDQRRNGGSLGKILLQKKLITIDQLYSALSKQYNIPLIKPDEFVFDESRSSKLSGIVDKEYAQKHFILPLSLKGNKLILALYEPDRISAVRKLESAYPFLRIQYVLVREESFQGHFEALYKEKPYVPKIEVKEENPLEDGKVTGIDFDQTACLEKYPEFFSGQTDSEAGDVVKSLIHWGIIHNASDIHIEQDIEGSHLRYRIAGALQTLKMNRTAAKFGQMAGRVISWIKALSDLDIAERRVPQNGIFRVTYSDKKKKQKLDLDLRVATCPTLGGENITLTILDYRKARKGLVNLNHSMNVLVPLKALLKRSGGAILVSGPAENGKISLIYGILKYMQHPGKKIVTVEDPIQYSFPGIMQTQVNRRLNLSLSGLLRAVLNHDPDVILLEEIRDEETAKLAFDVARTDRLLLGTIYSIDAVNVISRLLDLGVEREAIAGGLLGVVTQRLVKKICGACKKKYVPAEDEWRLLFSRYPAHFDFYKGEGCEKCNFTGYSDQTLISEILVIDTEVADALRKGADEKEIRRLAGKGGMKTMLDDGLMKLNQTTLKEIITEVPAQIVEEFQRRSLKEPPVAQQSVSPGDLKPSIHSSAGHIFVISDPEFERMQASRMYETYQNLKKSIGKPLDDSDASLFTQFILENYHRIRGKFGCNSVEFHLKAEKDQIVIFAAPQN